MERNSTTVNFVYHAHLRKKCNFLMIVGQPNIFPLSTLTRLSAFGGLLFEVVSPQFRHVCDPATAENLHILEYLHACIPAKNVPLISVKRKRRTFGGKNLAGNFFQKM